MICTKCGKAASFRVYFSDIEWDYVNACEDHVVYYESYKAVTAIKERKQKSLPIVE